MCGWFPYIAPALNALSATVIQNQKHHIRDVYSVLLHIYRVFFWSAYLHLHAKHIQKHNVS